MFSQLLHSQKRRGALSFAVPKISGASAILKIIPSRMISRGNTKIESHPWLVQS